MNQPPTAPLSELHSFRDISQPLLAGVEELPYIPFETGKVLTGRDAERSVADLWKRQAKKPNPDAQFPVESRRQRRAEKAADKRSLKRGRRLFVRRELAKERAADDLANLFALVDGSGPPIAPRIRAQQAINARVDYLLIEAIRKDPATTLTYDEVLAQLRAVAATAKPRRPQVKYDRGGVLQPGITEVRNNTGVAEPVITTGRTGRAG